MTDGELLQRYVRDGSEASFEGLVRRHINLVYSAALRKVNFDTHRAEDITQCVFSDLARKSAQLTAHTSLTGWLYTSTRFAAATLRRTEQRRSIREQEASAMNTLLSGSESQPEWLQLSPLLDEAMHKLEEQDREAVLLRHFENRSYADIGDKIGVSENAARMRVDRALEKLHGILVKQGAALTVAALAGLLSTNAVKAAPAYLAAKVASGAMAGAVVGGAFAGALSAALITLKSKLAVAALAAAVIGVVVYLYASKSSATGKIISQEASVVVTSTTNPPDVSSIAGATTNLGVKASAPVKTAHDAVLHLKIVAADSGKPIPMVPIDYRASSGKKLDRQHLVSDRMGELDVIYPTNVTELNLTTRKDGIADTHLIWRLSLGEIIPTNYLMRVDWPVAIGGQVVDTDGKPVAGASVVFWYQPDMAWQKSPQNHEFVSIQTKTDEKGAWYINRIAAEMMPRIDGDARHSNYVESATTFVGQDREAEKQLREGTYVFTLSRGTTVTGLVEDTNGIPIPAANILIGHFGLVGERSGKSQSDGTFSIRGCLQGKQPVTASADGYAVTTIEADLSDSSSPIRLTLGAGKTLRLRVVDAAGDPIPHASLVYDPLNPYPPGSLPMRAQTRFSATADDQGRVVWTNAPDGDIYFDVYASGFPGTVGVLVPPGDGEHDIMLKGGYMVVVHGTVSDAVTGDPITKFCIEGGQPLDSEAGITNISWSSTSWVGSSGGSYRHNFEGSVVRGESNPGHALKFMADGYAPFVSRVIKNSESDVELDAKLEPAAATTVTVYQPDGQPAVETDIGLAYPGAYLFLTTNSFSRASRPYDGSLLRTDTKGKFILPPDDSVIHVVAAGPSGYGIATPAELSANPIIQMQPWGRLELTCYSGGQPAGGREYRIQFADIPSGAVSLDPSTARATSDGQGKIIWNKVPYGNFYLLRHYPAPHGWSEGDKKPFQILPGQTTSLTWGMTNYRVTARMAWPDGMHPQTNWHFFSTVHTPATIIPPEIQNDPAALKQFQSDDFMAAQKAARAFPALENAGSLSADDVEAGDYEFYVQAYTLTSYVKPIAQGIVNITIPADEPFGAIDAGVIEMKPTGKAP